MNIQSQKDSITNLKQNDHLNSNYSKDYSGGKN
jgi:hypothetical protein